ncbi:MAG: NAD-dependent epimerase/dehydratase family protein [Chloroflexi bacterium]|nr:NAD-dependent epimerase/dehydratase family protein [Chloroflexota bacterium]
MAQHTVTGGAGFIGSTIAKSLLNRGDHVTVIDDLSSGYASNLEQLPGVDFIEASVLNDTAVRKAVAGSDTVFHLAASVGNKRSIDDPISDAKTNLLGTINVLEASRSAGVRKIVVSSSAGIFGELKELPINESHPLEPDSPYGVSKLAAEKVCLAYSRLYDLEAIALRYFNVYGPNQRFDAYGNVIPIFVFKLLNNEPITIFGDGEQTRDFVSVHDVVQANLAASKSEGVSGAFNIASGTRITINDLVSMLDERIPMNCEIRTGEPRPGDVRDSLGDIWKARELIGFDPQVSLDAGLTEYVDWAQQEIKRT